MGNLLLEAGQKRHGSSSAGVRTTKNIPGNFSLKLLQPFLLRNIISVILYLRNKEKIFFFFGKKIFSLKTNLEDLV